VGNGNIDVGKKTATRKPGQQNSGPSGICGAMAQQLRQRSRQRIGSAEIRAAGGLPRPEIAAIRSEAAVWRYLIG
jgi:hypothetical protein